VASSAQPYGAEPNSKRIVIVVGPGRSGTSTIAGALAKSGLEVPGRTIEGNPTNPSGFYEPRWVVDFHRKLLDRNNVGNLDSSPDGLERMSRATAKQDVRVTLHRWLAERLEEQPRLVVKDPRTVWFRDLWVDTARELGIEPAFVTMVRHPAEVSTSRQTAYNNPDAVKRSDEVNRIAGWINVSLIAERVTQGSPRSFVRYTDLVADWRQVLGRLGGTLHLDFDPALDVTPHPVDEFIDPSLHRVHVDWADVGVPVALRDLGEKVWQALSRLSDEGESEDLSAEIGRLREQYAQMTEDAMSLSRQAIRRTVSAAQRKARRQLREELAKQTATTTDTRTGGIWQRFTSGRS